MFFYDNCQMTGVNCLKKPKYNENVTLEFEYAPNFMKLWSHYGLTSHDLARFEQEVKDFEETNEDGGKTLGDLIETAGGAIKYRFSSSEDPSGKSGGYRIIYYRYGRRIYSMVIVYSKADKSSLTQGEKNDLRASIQKTKRENKKT